MVDLRELLPASVVSDIVTYVSHPTADPVKERLEGGESNWDFLVGMKILEAQNASYCVKYFVVCQCSEAMVEYLSGLDLAPKAAQLRA